ncbi:MAG TPA: hypothetical protein VLS90_20910, partial [Thermodesulfobacteriota bacterium]|nr:hypothetical protein [Thermodesulfobacteriota bacterium]
EKIRYMAEGFGITNVYAILNKVPSRAMEGKLREMMGKKEIKTAGTIFLDPEIADAALGGGKLPEGTQAEEQAIKLVKLIMADNQSSSCAT